MTIILHGHCDKRFANVAAVFESLFTSGEELGARFSVVLDQRPVIDLWGGRSRAAANDPFGPDTLVPVFSVTKALAAVMVARLVDQGRLDYDQPVVQIWPEFGQAGKDQITIGQLMSHQAGLPGFLEPMEPALWFDWAAIIGRLERMAPLWPPGSASGYHAITLGYLAGELFRRVDGRSLGTALREDIAQPSGLDLWIGLPLAEHDRCADLQRPKSLPDFGATTDPRRAAFLTPWAAPGGRGGAAWRQAEIPSANGHATALALAKLMGALATDEPLGGVMILSPKARSDMAAVRISGPDLVLPFDLAWGAGVMASLPNGFYGPGAKTFGHSGWGGACAFADPLRGLGAAYVMNRQSAHLIGDPRSRRLIDAVYSAL